MTHLTKPQLVREATLTEADLEQVRQRRRDYNRLGFAYQVAFVRLFNRFPKQVPLEVSRELLVYVSIQVELPDTLLDIYTQRQQTISSHQREIMAYLKRVAFGEAETEKLVRFLYAEACRLTQASALQASAEVYLKEHRILKPADSTLERLIGEQRRLARSHIFERLAATVSDEIKTVLDALLQVKKGQSVSALQRLKANPRRPSPAAMLSLVAKLKALGKTQVLTVDLTWLSSNFQRSLFHYVNRCSVDRLREASPPRRYGALLCFLWQSYQDTVDQAIDMFDKLMTGVYHQSQQDVDAQLIAKRQNLQKALALFKSLGNVILDESVADDQLRNRLFQAVPKDELTREIQALNGWLAHSKDELLQGVVKRHSYLRRFTPTLLEALTFRAEGDHPSPCLKALAVLKTLNEAGKRKLPAEVTTDFVPVRWRDLVLGDPGQPDKSAWECALLTQLRDEIRVGNISVAHSKHFGRFDDYFIPSVQWGDKRLAFFERAGFPAKAEQVAGYLQQRLNTAFDQFLEAAAENTYARVDEASWQLSKDVAEKLDTLTQQRLDILKSWLDQQMRHIRLPDLLIEVDNALNFTRHLRPSAASSERPAEDICAVLAALMAHGCNIGIHTMAQLVQGVSYKQLKRITEWQLTEETQRAALAEVVNAIAHLDTSQHWGQGTTSASDGQRFALPRQVLQQTYSPKFSDYALEFYSFVADNYAPFYTMPIECTDRDAAFVLDGLLYNENDLALEEHYTDTHGYTEINFAAFAFLGRRFCPRLKGLQHQRLYRLDTQRDYGSLAPLVSRAQQTLNPQIIAEQWDRMGQFYASLEQGHTTASVALKRLVGYNAKNRFYRANRDLGRVLKTEFLLQYLAEPGLRRRIRRGLLKVEQLHALARDLYYGRRGRINARELHEQMNSCSCLTLILACIIYWQAQEITRVVALAEERGHELDTALLEHISPIEWDNIVLYGEYMLDRKRVLGTPQLQLDLNVDA
jgi:TnpA family transposase